MSFGALCRTKVRKAERVDFEDIKIHNENNEASTKSESVRCYLEHTAIRKWGKFEIDHFSPSDMHLSEWASSREGCLNLHM